MQLHLGKEAEEGFRFHAFRGDQKEPDFSLILFYFAFVLGKVEAIRILILF